MRALRNRFLIILFISAVFLNCCYGFADRYSKEYLQSKKHFAIINPAVEKVVEKAIKAALKKETGVNFKVSFTGYTTSSMKKGIFKSLEFSGENLKIQNLPVDYVSMKTLTDYNYIDYRKNPVEFKSDMTFSYDIVISEETINLALQDKRYQKNLNKVNNLTYPLFALENVRMKIIKNKLYFVIDYNFPIARSSRERTFVTSADFIVENGEIKAKNVYVNSAYGNIGLDRVANLLNLLNPLEFTLDLMESKKCDGNVENVNIIDNKIKVDGKIFVKGDISQD